MLRVQGFRGFSGLWLQDYKATCTEMCMTTLDLASLVQTRLNPN